MRTRTKQRNGSGARRERSRSMEIQSASRSVSRALAPVSFREECVFKVNNERAQRKCSVRAFLPLVVDYLIGPGALLLTSTIKSNDSLIEVLIYWNGTTSFWRFGRDALIN